MMNIKQKALGDAAWCALDKDQGWEEKLMLGRESTMRGNDDAWVAFKPSFSNGGDLKGQHQRTVEMLELIRSEQPLSHLLFFLYDTQTTHEELLKLAEIALASESHRRT